MSSRRETIDRWVNLIDAGQGYSGFDVEFYRRALNGHARYNFCRVLDRCCGQHSRVLEAGCGSAFYCFFLAERGRSVTAMDVDRKLIDELTAVARQLGGSVAERLRLIHRDLFELDGLGEKFDVIFSDGTYQHFTESQDRIEMLAIFRRNLAEGGKCIVAVPNLDSPFYGVSLHGKTPDMKRFTFASLASELETAGFRMVESGYKFVNPGFEQWLRSGWMRFPVKLLQPLFSYLPRMLQGIAAPHFYCVAERV